MPHSLSLINQQSQIMQYTTITHRLKHITKLSLCVGAMLSLVACGVPRPNIYIPKNPPSSSIPKKQPNIALVLGGGGTKGFALAGAIAVFEKAGIPIDLIVGTSAGSIVGALYADNPNSQSLINLILHTKKSEVLQFSIAHLGTGFIQGYQLQDYLLKNMHAKTFKQLKIPFIAVTTNYLTGQSYPLSSGPIAPAINASAAVPGLFYPVRIYGKVLVDGGVSQPVPVLIAKQYHPKMIIAINIGDQLPKKVPEGIIANLVRTYNMTANNLTQLQTKEADIILYPDLGDVGIIDDTHRGMMLKAGQLVAEKALPAIKKLMKQKGIALVKKRNIPKPPKH